MNYFQRYYLKNRDKKLVYQAVYRKKNSKKISLERLSRWRSADGRLQGMYNAQRQRAKKKGFSVEYTLFYLRNRFSKNKKYLSIHLAWKKSGYKKEFSPSIDRIDSRQGYTKKNIRMVPWSENNKKGRFEKRGRAVIQKLKGVNSKKFPSISKASRQTGISISVIWKSCNGKRSDVVFEYEK